MRPPRFCWGNRDVLEYAQEIDPDRVNMPDGKLWTQRDRHRNEIYLTRERWAHIVENHPEVEIFFDWWSVYVFAGKRMQPAQYERRSL